MASAHKCNFCPELGVHEINPNSYACDKCYRFMVLEPEELKREKLHSEHADIDKSFSYLA